MSTPIPPRSIRDASRHLVPSWVIVSAARYGLLRQTYIAGMTEGLVREHWADMHPADQDVIIRDLSADIRLLDRIGDDRVGRFRALHTWCQENRTEL